MRDFKLYDKVHKHGVKGVVRGFTRSGKVIVKWNFSGGIEALQPEELNLGAVSVKEVADVVLNMKQVRL